MILILGQEAIKPETRMIVEPRAMLKRRRVKLLLKHNVKQSLKGGIKIFIKEVAGDV